MMQLAHTFQHSQLSTRNSHQGDDRRKHGIVERVVSPVERPSVQPRAQQQTQQSSQQSSGANKEDDVVDAEFEEVKDDNK